jgi:dienelactone hydrolase
MANSLKLLAVFCIILSIFLCSLFSAYHLNADFGRLENSTVKIETDQGVLTGLLYKPADSENRQFPAIVIAHGISESAHILSSLGLELSRGGFVVLCLDLPGHGGSDGWINQGQQDPTLGVVDAVNYLTSLPFVDSTQIGLIGHSLGAGAVRAANTKLSNIQASVLIGGGVGVVANEPQYGSFNATYPKNVLIIIGKYDVLFDVAKLEKEDLLNSFNTTKPIQQGVLYGDIYSQTARKLIVPQTTHLFEALDSVAINQTTVWMQQTLKTNQTYKAQLSPIYQYREITQALSVLALVSLILLTFYPIARFLKEKPKTLFLQDPIPSWKKHLTWFIVNTILFFPLIALGLAIGFPPLIFGSSIAWWLLLLSFISIVVFRSLSSKYQKVSIVDLLRKNLPSKKILLIAIINFLALLLIVSCLQFFGISLKIVAPIFQDFASVRRVLVFFAFLPFFLPYFFVQQLYLLTNDFGQKGKREYIKLIIISVSPFLTFLALNFLPKFFLDFWIIPSFAGFLIEFLWLMVPIFMITTFCSLHFYKRTNNFALGTIFNTLLFAWIAATVFPF